MHHTLAVAVIAVVLPLGYAFSCWVFPWARCLWCEGRGRKYRGDGRVWRDCRWCRGTGRRLRLGRWAYNRLSATRAKAK